MRSGGFTSAAALALAVCVWGGDGRPAAAADPADVHWAQETLRAKGYNIGGRPSSKWTDASKHALTSFQRANGLPASGELDAATMAKLSAVRTPAASMGTLGAPQPGSSGTRSSGRAESAPQPKAAPTSRVGAEGGESGVIGGVTLGAPSAAPSSSFSASGQPHAAPVPRVGVEGDGPSPSAAPRAQVTGGDGRPAGGVLDAVDGGGFQAANWMRYGVGGVLAATLAAMGLGWWRSGRRRNAAAAGAFDLERDDDERPTRRRVEPSFGAVDDRRSGLPPLTAPARSRR